MQKKYIPSVITIIVIISIFFGVKYYKKNKISNSENLVSYNRDIRPILSDKCFACHGPDANKRKAGLRLDLQSEAYAELNKNKGHFAIIPGNPDKSELISRIESNDPSILMPLPESHLTKLNHDEINLFRKWIKEGAKYEKHWAFVAPVKAPLPEVNNKSWTRNEIDQFILHKLDQKGFTPNDEAAKEILIKRAFADITGLPPTYQEINHWSGTSGKDWYNQLLDTLLQKPSYGEKMAILWCDLARYADSFGFVLAKS